jgi:hypothetical protein
MVHSGFCNYKNLLFVVRILQDPYHLTLNKVVPIVTGFGIERNSSILQEMRERHRNEKKQSPLPHEILYIAKK